MAKIAQATVFINAELGNFQKGLSQAKREFRSTMGNITDLADKTGKKMIGLGAALGGGLLLAANTAKNFNQSMREVNTLINLSEDDFKAFKDEIREVARTLGIDVNEAAQAVYQALSAGVPKENVIDFLKTAAKGAIGGVTDVKTAVDGATTVINAFGLDVKDADMVLDKMFATMKGGKTTIGELSRFFFQAAPDANALGVSFGELNAHVVALTKQGVPTSQAMTRIRAAIDALSKPSKDLTEIFKAAGYESGEMAIRQVGLQKAMEIVTKATGGSVGALKGLLGSSEAAGAVLGVTGDKAILFSDALRDIENSAGAANKAFEEMDKDRQLEHIVAQLKDIALAIGEAVLPSLKALADYITPIIKGIGDWVRDNPKLFQQLLVLSGILLAGGVLLRGTAILARDIGIIWNVSKNLGSVLPGVTGAVRTFAGSMGTLAGATNAVLFGLAGGAAAGGLYALYQMFQDLLNGGIGENWVSRLIDRFGALSKIVDRVFDKIAGIARFIYGGGIIGELLRDEPKLGDRTKQLQSSGLIPGNANGTNNWRGGPTWVGERGPEIVNVPRGSQILSNADSMRMMGGMNQSPITVNMNFSQKFNESDAMEVWRMIGRARARIA